MIAPSVEGAFTDDFRFCSPFDDKIDKAIYFTALLEGTPAGSRSRTLKTIIVEGEASFVTYRCVAQEGQSFRNTEFFPFAGDKVRRIEVYFGHQSWKKKQEWRVPARGKVMRFFFFLRPQLPPK